MNVAYYRMFAFRTLLISVADIERSLFEAVGAPPFAGGRSYRQLGPGHRVHPGMGACSGTARREPPLCLILSAEPWWSTSAR